jgi:hypothetical protein
LIPNVTRGNDDRPWIMSGIKYTDISYLAWAKDYNGKETIAGQL